MSIDKQEKQNNFLEVKIMTRIYELESINDPRKSFYGKAHVIDHGNGVYELQSYDTIVSRCDHGKVTHLGKWSNTTTKHKKEFEKQFSN